MGVGSQMFFSGIWDDREGLCCTIVADGAGINANTNVAGRSDAATTNINVEVGAVVLHIADSTKGYVANIS